MTGDGAEEEDDNAFSVLDYDVDGDGADCGELEARLEAEVL